MLAANENYDQIWPNMEFTVTWTLPEISSNFQKVSGLLLVCEACHPGRLGLWAEQDLLPDNED